ncbi:MAG: DPP IV N-terminal domain-containing protein, partial [Gemmataceae bacterium]|nr:DPP IV N-terminal domain-containing protein [Gemmataceae bacterium]
AAARELGIPEGTLSSRLAAARKVLAARLRDRGLAAAVLAAVAAQARGSRPVWSSEVSSPVTELTEAVMRTGLRWKVVAAVVVAAAGLGAYARPAAPEEAPAPRPADPSRLIVGFAGHVRYLTPDGREVARVTGDQVKAAGAEINTRTLAIDPFRPGPWVTVSPNFAPSGRAAPDGRLPVLSSRGLYLASAGPPAAVTPVKAKGGEKGLLAGEESPHLAAWSPDGKRAVGGTDEFRLFQQDAYVHSLIDLEAGTVEPLNLPVGHLVLDWSPDGAWFVTYRRASERLTLFGGGTWGELCRVSADGRRVERLAEPREGAFFATYSPDGTKVAYARVTTSPVVRPVRGGTESLEVCNGFAVVVLDLATMTRTTVLSAGGGRVLDIGESAAGVRWSPDGTRLAVVSHMSEGRATGRNRVRVCDADGGNPRVVLETDPADWNRVIAGPTVFDWR